VSTDRFSWSDLIYWAIDQYVFTGSPSLRSELPAIESKDGQEPTDESRIEEARRIDALKQTDAPRKLSAQKGKALDQEFWNTF